MGVLVADGSEVRANFCNPLTPDDMSDRRSRSRPAGPSSSDMLWCVLRGSPLSANWAGSCMCRPNSCRAYMTNWPARAFVTAWSCGLSRAELAADRKGVSTLGTRHHRRGHAVGGRSRLCGEIRQARRIHRARGAAAAAGIRVPKRLVQFQLKSPEPLLYHNEPIWHGERSSASSAPACTATLGCGRGSRV